MPLIGLQLWTVKDRLTEPERLFDDIAPTGVTVLEPFGLGNPDTPLADRVAWANRLRLAAENAGLRLESTHAFLPSVDQITPWVDEMAALGVSTALAAVPESLAGFDRSVLANAEALIRYADALNALGARAADHGLRIGYHNHAFDWERASPQSLAYDLLVSRLEADIVLEFDILWAQYAGQDPVAIVRQLADRIKYLHIDDADRLSNTERYQVPAGAGEAALAESIAAASPALEVLYIEATTPPTGMTHLELVALSAQWLRERLAQTAIR